MSGELEMDTQYKFAPTRRQLLAGAAALGGLSVAAIDASADDSGISRAAEAIHQEPVFQASRPRVYEALTDAKKFDQVSRLSEAMRSMASGNTPAAISSEVGGSFSLFNGYITGRHIELVPNERIVQAWRSAWKPGEYSIVKFVLADEGSGTKIIFDHRGFPDGAAQHLAAGWKVNYWEPLEKYFAVQK
ncbi:MAG: SRPBCC domain-containing protein [Candidatus Sulfotelmatobacter sp.]